MHGLTALEDLEYNNHKDDLLFDKANDLIHKYFDDPDGDAEQEHYLSELPSAPPGGFNF